MVCCIAAVELTASGRTWPLPLKVGKLSFEASLPGNCLQSPSRKLFWSPTIASRAVAQKNAGDEQGSARKIGTGRKDHKSLLERIAFEIEHKWEGSRGTTPVERAITWALRGAVDASDVGCILGGIEIPLPVFTSVIRKLGVEGHPGAAHALVQWMCVRPARSEEDRPNVYIYNSLLGALKVNRRYDVMDQVIAEIPRRRIVPDIVTWNTVMKMHEERQNLQDALDLFLALKRAGVEPNLVTYRMVFRILAKQGDITCALEMFADLRRERRDRRVSTCVERVARGLPHGEHELVDAVASGVDDQWQQMEKFMKELCAERLWLWLSERKEASEIGKLFASMQAACVELGSSTCVDLLHKCGTREVDQVLIRRLYTVLRSRHMPLSISLCNHVIRALGKGKKWWAALQVFEEMIEIGPRPNEATYKLLESHFNVLFNAARRRRIWKWSLQLLDKMLEKGLEPGMFVWNAVLVTCAKANQPSAALLVFHRMIQAGQKPDVLSYGALLSSFEKAGWHAKAVQLWAHMKRIGVQPNDAAYTIMICVHGNSGNYEECVRTVKCMQEERVNPSLVTYNALITACARVGNSEGALNWLDKMSAAWIMPDAITYDQLIRAFSADGKWEQARGTYERMVKLNLKPSQVVNDLMNKSCSELQYALSPQHTEQIEPARCLELSEHASIGDLQELYV